MMVATMTMALSVVFCGALVEWIARRRDPRRLFFVALGRPLTAADERRRARLRLLNVVMTVLGVGLVLAPVADWLRAFGATVPPTVSCLALAAASIGAARSATLERVPGRYAISLDDAPTARDLISAPLQVANVLAVVVPCALLAWGIASLPALVPMHWDASGAVDRMGDPRELWGLAGVMVFDLLLLWALVWGMTKERWAVPTENEERYFTAAFERRASMVRFIEWVMLSVNASMGLGLVAVLVAASGDPSIALWMGLGVIVLSLAGVLGPMVIYMPRIVRAQDRMRKLAGTEVLGTRPDGWRLGGLVYYAPEDPALFIPKRVGIGQTLNMARPASWVFLGLVLGIPTLITIVLTVVG